MKKQLIFAAMLAAALFAGLQARAEDAKHSGAKGEGPCLADGAKLCPGMKPGDGKFGPCMKEHEADLSSACKDVIANAKDKLKERVEDKALEACGLDTDKFCGGMKPGDGKWGPCLEQRKKDLTPSCKRFFLRAKQWKERRGEEKK